MSIANDFQNLRDEQNSLEAQKFLKQVAVSLFAAYRANGNSCEDALKMARADLAWLLKNGFFEFQIADSGLGQD